MALLIFIPNNKDLKGHGHRSDYVLQVYGALIASGMVAWQHTGVAQKLITNIQWFIFHAVIEYVGRLVFPLSCLWHFNAMLGNGTARTCRMMMVAIVSNLELNS